MARRHKCPDPGAPAWVLTYGDMMSLLLVFFILLVSLSEIKKEDKYRAIVQEVKKAFGMKGGGGKMQTKDDPELSLIKRLEALQLRSSPESQRSNTEDPGVEGKEPTVTTIRKGMLFVVGGPITFEPGSAELSDRAKRTLDQVATLVSGHNNKIEVRGHAASMEMAEAGGRYSDLWELSYARAKAVADYLMQPRVGVRPDRIRVIANADREPQRLRAYTPSSQEPNRRVEVVVSEELVEDHQPTVSAIY
jgi:chemotaxis protein MotB